MSDLRKAAEMALEALEQYTNKGEKYVKVLRRLKRSARITSYIQPKKIVVTRNQADIVQRLGLTIEAYAKAYFDNFCAYKRRYC